jgi:hypothetical protein
MPHGAVHNLVAQQAEFARHRLDNPAPLTPARPPPERRAVSPGPAGQAACRLAQGSYLRIFVAAGLEPAANGTATWRACSHAGQVTAAAQVSGLHQVTIAASACRGARRLRVPHPMVLRIVTL